MNNTASDNNRFSGIANATGVIDRGGDVIAPGAFRDSLPGFLERGFVSLAHDWESLPVAMPVSAEEVGSILRVTAEFHSTAMAQEARAVVQERLAQGLEVGLSIGYRTEPTSCLGFRSGADLLAHVKREGLTGFDEPALLRWKTPCRLVREVAELFEVSIVSVPMNPHSRIQEAKSPAQLRADQQRSALRLNRARTGE